MKAIHKYILLITTIACTGSAMENNKGVQVRTTRPDWSEGHAKVMAEKLYRYVKEFDEISDDVEQASPENVRNRIIRYIDQLKLSEREENDVFDAYMPLHRLTRVWEMPMSKIIQYKLSPKGDRLALFGRGKGKQDRGLTPLFFIEQDENGWMSPCYGVVLPEEYERIQKIEWNAAGILYSMHGKDRDNLKHAAAWEKDADGRYRVVEEYTPQYWHCFYSEHGLANRELSDGAGGESRPLMNNAKVEEVSGNRITVSTAVTTVPAMHRYLEKEYQRTLQEYQRTLDASKAQNKE